MKPILWALLGLGVAWGAQADIYKHIDADGRVTYSSKPSKGATKLIVKPPPPPPTNAEPHQERPSAVQLWGQYQAQKQQQTAQRRTLLEQALNQERQALESAKALYAEAEMDPEVFTRVVGENGMSVLGGREGPVIVVDDKLVIDAEGNPVHQLMTEDGTRVFRTQEGTQIPVPFDPDTPDTVPGPPIVIDGNRVVDSAGNPVPQSKKTDGTLVFRTQDQVPVQFNNATPGFVEGPPVSYYGKPLIGTDGSPVPQLMNPDSSLVYKSGTNNVTPFPFIKQRGRNMAWYSEKLNKLAEEIKTHEDNIEILEKELSGL